MPKRATTIDGMNHMNCFRKNAEGRGEQEKKEGVKRGRRDRKKLFVNEKQLPF
jgi:hypothetical protein